MKYLIFFMLIQISAHAEKIDFNSLISDSQLGSPSDRVTLGQASQESTYFSENIGPREQEIKIKIHRQPTPLEVKRVQAHLRKKLARIKSESSKRKLSEKRRQKTQANLKFSKRRTTHSLAGSNHLKNHGKPKKFSKNTKIKAELKNKMALKNKKHDLQGRLFEKTSSVVYR